MVLYYTSLFIDSQPYPFKPTLFILIYLEEIKAGLGHDEMPILLFCTNGATESEKYVDNPTRSHSTNNC